MQAVFAGLARQHVGAAQAIEDIGNFDQHIAGVARGLLLIARELDSKMADPSRGQAAGQGQIRGFGGDHLLAVVTDGVVGDRAAGIEEDIISSPIPCRVDAQGELMVGREIEVELAVRGIADLRRWIFTSERGQLRCGGKDQRLIGGFVVPRRIWAGAGLRDDLGTAVEKLDYIGHVKDVLIESGEEEGAISPNGAADRASKLLLTVMGLKREEGVGRAEGAVPQMIEDSAM